MSKTEVSPSSVDKSNGDNHSAYPADTVCPSCLLLSVNAQLAWLAKLPLPPVPRSCATCSCCSQVSDFHWSVRSETLQSTDQCYEALTQVHVSSF